MLYCVRRPAKFLLVRFPDTSKSKSIIKQLAQTTQWPSWARLNFFNTTKLKVVIGYLLQHLWHFSFCSSKALKGEANRQRRREGGREGVNFYPTEWIFSRLFLLLLWKPLPGGRFQSTRSSFFLWNFSFFSVRLASIAALLMQEILLSFYGTNKTNQFNKQKWISKCDKILIILHIQKGCHYCLNL